MISNDYAVIAERIFAALESRDFDRAVEEVSEDALLLSVATGDVYRGRSGFLQFARGWATAFPDLELKLVHFGSSDDRLVVEYERSGTHTGPLVTPRGHLPPTGMAMQIRFCDVMEIRDGKIAHIRSYFDTLSFLRQLGLVAGSPLHAPDRRASLELYAQLVDGSAPQRHKSIVHRYLNDVFNRQNPGATADTCTGDFRWHGGILGETRGLDAYQGVLAAFFYAFPDVSIEVLDSIAEGDRVVVRYSMSGTHLGEFHGIPPSRARVTGRGTNIFRIEESRIGEEWWMGDVLDLMQQMGAIPPGVRLQSGSGGGLPPRQ